MNKKPTILIAGGTGLIGKALDLHLSHLGYHVRILTRNPGKYSDPRFLYWNIDAKQIDEAAFPADVIINLTGEGIADKKWTRKRKRALIDSRVIPAQFLLESAVAHQESIPHYIGASAIGYYGNSENQLMTEDDGPGSDFLSQCTLEWEQANEAWKSKTKHWSLIRIGIVLSPNGGALEKMLMTTKLGVANYFGNGNQYYSWIHLDDLCRLFSYIIEKKLSGVYNGVSTQAISNKDFMKVVQKVVKRKTVLLPVPAVILKLGMGEMSSILLNSNKVSAEKIIQAGFEFKYPNLGEAISDLIH